MNKGFLNIGLTAFLAILIVVITIFFIFVTTRNNDTRNTTTPTETPSPSLSGYTPLSTYTPLPTPTPVATNTLKLTPSLTPTPSIKPVLSGIKGLATFKSCTSNGCTTSAVVNMRIDIKTKSNVVINTLHTDSSGRYSVNLDPGEYLIGPFQDPVSSAVVNQAIVKVNKGYFSEVNIKFESTL